jgi:hypothetical protein
VAWELFLGRETDSTDFGVWPRLLAFSLISFCFFVPFPQIICQPAYLSNECNVSGHSFSSRRIRSQKLGENWGDQIETNCHLNAAIF